MSREWDGPVRVELDAALRSMIHEIGLVGARPGMHTEEVELELRFTLEPDDSGGARPVVHLEGAASDLEVHSVRVTLRPQTLSGGLDAAAAGNVSPNDAPALPAGGGSEPPARPVPAKRRPRRRLKPRPAAVSPEGDAPPEASTASPPRGSAQGHEDEGPKTPESPRAEAPTAASVVEELLGHDPLTEGGPNWELREPPGMNAGDLPPSASVGLGGQPAGLASASTNELVRGDDFPEDDSTDTLDASDILEENEDTET